MDMQEHKRLYNVESETDKSIKYRVVLDDDNPVCSCCWFMFQKRVDRVDCKHIEKAKEWEKNKDGRDY